jgi:hypothetical protein
MFYRTFFAGVIFLALSAQSDATEPQIIALGTTNHSEVKAGFGSFQEQVHALRAVIELQGSPGALLEQVTTCRTQEASSGATDLCDALLSASQTVLNEYGAGRPRMRLVHLMMMIERGISSTTDLKVNQRSHAHNPLHLGSFREQVQSLGRANALLESPGNLLEQIAKCRIQQSPLSDLQRESCHKLLADTRDAVHEYSAVRPRVSLEVLMRALSDAMQAKPGDAVAIKDRLKK